MDENEDKMTAREREAVREKERERTHSITPILNLPSHTKH